MTNYTKEELSDLLKRNPALSIDPNFMPNSQNIEAKVPEESKYHSERTGHYQSKKEADWQKEVIELLHADGWTVCEFRKARIKKDGKDVYRTPFGADGVGFPDLIAVKGKRCLFIEDKSEYGRLRREQEGWLIRLMNLHTESMVWRPSDREKIASELEETT